MKFFLSFRVGKLSEWCLHGNFFFKSVLYLFKAKGFGMVNTVCTLYELTSGDDTQGQGKVNNILILDIAELCNFQVNRLCAGYVRCAATPNLFRTTLDYFLPKAAMLCVFFVMI